MIGRGMYELNCVIKVTYVIAGVITIFLFLNEEVHTEVVQRVQV